MGCNLPESAASSRKIEGFSKWLRHRSAAFIFNNSVEQEFAEHTEAPTQGAFFNWLNSAR